MKSEKSEKSKAHVCFLKVSKKYDRHHVIENLDLAVRHSEFLTILGPSGSGKSTILMLLAGFERLSAGDITINGRSIAQIPPHKRNIGMVFQNYALFPHMTVAENLAYPLRFKNLSKADREKKVQEFLVLVRLEGLDGRYPSQLSGGQKQRVALARALIYAPNIVLMDEPLGALDKKLREQMQYEIKKLHQLLGFTMIYVTHDQSEALTMSDRVLVLNEAKVQQLSDTKSLYYEPNNIFVAQFIGENNQLNVQWLKQESAHYATVALEGQAIRVHTKDYLEHHQNVQLFIRPESISLFKQKQSANEIAISFEEVIFIGDHYRIKAKTKGGQTLIIRHQGALSKATLAAKQNTTCYFLTQHSILLCV